MNEPLTPPPEVESLLPPGTIVELEIYHCVVKLPDVGEAPAVAVTCDILQKALVITAESLLTIMQEHKIMPGTQRFYAELASAFQKQCALPSEECRLWNLHWPEFLDRRLMVIVKLEIQPTQGE